MKLINWIILFIIVLFIASAFSEDVDMSIIAQIESNNNPMAVSYRGAKYGRGLHQISQICLVEYNNYHEKKYTITDLFNKRINTKIADWYMNIRIPQMLKYYGIEDTVKNRLWAYNAGIGKVVNGIMPAETVKYLDKYRQKESK